MTLRVMIVVTHLLGAGHLTRAAALARAFAARGHAATLVSGGMPSRLVRTEGVRLVQLPPVRTAGTDFRTLLDESGEAVGEGRLSARRDLLLATLAGTRPDVLVTELFPFGRRALHREFLTLLEAAHAQGPRPLVACSIRDILATPTRPERIVETHERLARFYDLVLVHGDPGLVALVASWPLADALRPLVRYTGYVDEGEAIPGPAERAGVLVSGGSSAASVPLYRAALDAARAVPDEPWRILVGNGVDESTYRELCAGAAPRIVIERARPDFRRLLGRAAVSVSQAGYNTAVDLLRAGPAAVLVPFEAGHETEQRLRAEELARRGLAAVVPEAELSGARLAEAVAAALHRKPTLWPVMLDGAARSVALVEERLRAPAIGMSDRWRALDDALARARDAGWQPQFWWRDDDAVADTPALNRLLALAESAGVPLALAVVPGRLEASLAPRLADAPQASALVHGFLHANHAGPGERKAEFGPHRPVAVMAREAGAALVRLRGALGTRCVPAFVPPWNRIAPDLVPLLPDLDFVGLSRFKDRDPADAVPRLVEVNTHLDPIDWHGSRSLLDPDALIAAAAAAVERRTAGSADRGEPIGLLTHHLVHDAAVWRFCEALIGHLAPQHATFASAEIVFASDNGASWGSDTGSSAPS